MLIRRLDREITSGNFAIYYGNYNEILIFVIRKVQRAEIDSAV